MTMEELIGAAKREEWDFVDEQIPAAVRFEVNVVWAYRNGLNNSDGNVRDLAASMLVKAKLSPTGMREAKPALLRVMKSDSNPYARYRSAFALAEHGYATKPVLAVLSEAEKDKDKDVRGEARKYLRKLAG